MTEIQIFEAKRAVKRQPWEDGYDSHMRKQLWKHIRFESLKFWKDDYDMRK